MNSIRLRIGLYGMRGHQLPFRLPETVRADIAAVVYDDPARTRDTPANVRRHPDLDALLADPTVGLVSLCSARRSEQADHARRCLEAGKHVLAEKPCAFDNATLDSLLATARRADRKLFEMADAELAAPVQAIRRLTDAGALGEIVQVQAQKSYPWHDRRPQDGNVDGGLVRQVGIHAVRFIHGATGRRIVRARGTATALGNPGSDGDLRMAASFAIELDNGGVGTIALNYLNPSTFGVWGNDQLRVFGTKGMAESVDGFRRHALFLPERGSATDLPVPNDLPDPLHLRHVVDHLLDGTSMPVPHEEEMAMTRAMLALHEAAETGAAVTVRYGRISFPAA